ncbi:hypothetical protein LCGC14_1649580 [marine sediment metagenome]|uniref:Elp3/MiaA/NifB-like radical SAM core domain-containing protein n=1 Tax=marine sediment metagenome TaxID=412755 RepID=A0A0F9HX86_9ZZZZ
MKVLLLNIDSKLPNIALHKIEMWHKLQGDEVIWDMPIMLGQTDRAYASCIFTKNRYKLENYKNLYPSLIAGGSGWDLVTSLPSEIDAMKPKINYGFTTRGCIRQCSFCIVPRKEGYIHIVGDLLDIWDGKAKKVLVMDNNILALPNHFTMICKQALEYGVKLDFNQGLDHRLLTPSLVRTMVNISHTEYRFAFDKPSYMKSVDQAINILRKNGINRCIWYVLVGYDTTPKEDLIRLNFLREMGQRAYLQRYGSHYSEPFYKALAGWCNQRHLFATKTFQEFLELPRWHRERQDIIESDIEL